MIGERVMKKYINLKNILFWGLIIVFAVTRLWKLASLPYGLHVDEAAMAYDARCLAEYGYDRFKTYIAFTKKCKSSP